MRCGFKFSNRSEICQAPPQQRRRDTCHIAERHNHVNIQSRHHARVGPGTIPLSTHSLMFGFVPPVLLQNSDVTKFLLSLNLHNTGIQICMNTNDFESWVLL